MASTSEMGVADEAKRQRALLGMAVCFHPTPRSMPISS